MTLASRRIATRIFFLTCLFVIFGLLMVYDVSIAQSVSVFGNKYGFVKQQAMWALFGFVGLIICAKIPTKFWLTMGPVFFVLAVVLLAAVLIPGVGSKVAGARRWLAFGPFVFQPSELVKLSYIFYLSTWLLKKTRFLSFLLPLCTIFALVMLQPDLGSGLVISSIAFGMYFAAGKPLKHLIWLLLFGVLGIGALIVLSPYRFGRLTTYLNPEADPLGKSYHVHQMTLALGNGGLFGQGLGRSKQKYRYIPEAATDSIFAILAEELGFVGCAMILFGYVFLITQSFSLVREQEKQTYLLGVGIICWLSAQTIVNIASVVDLIPLTGVPLPFISYGGSALVMTLLGIGILLGTSTVKVQEKSRFQPRRV